MELVNITDNKNNIVVKHQDLVRNARYRLGEIALKTLTMLISMIKSDDSDFHEYAIKLDNFRELIGTDSKNVFKYVDKMTTELMSKPFWVGKQKFNWVTTAKYMEGEGVVKFEIHRDLRPYLLELRQNFLQYNVANVLRLRSSYIIRLYELCKDQLNEKANYGADSVTFTLSIAKMRELFEIPTSYMYRDIRIHILDKAVKQFKEKTDIRISYKPQKIGKRVDSVAITVQNNNKGSNDFLASRESFIAYIRKNCVNKDLLEAINTAGNFMIVSVGPSGKLYDKRTGIDYNEKRANKIWDLLYGLGKEDKLKCLGGAA